MPPSPATMTTLLSSSPVIAQILPEMMSFARPSCLYRGERWRGEPHGETAGGGPADLAQGLDELRRREKAATRELDAIAAQRRRLPMVEMPDYTLIGEDGP